MQVELNVDVAELCLIDKHPNNRWSGDVLRKLNIEASFCIVRIFAEVPTDPEHARSCDSE